MFEFGALGPWVSGVRLVFASQPPFAVPCVGGLEGVEGYGLDVGHVVGGWGGGVMASSPEVVSDALRRGKTQQGEEGGGLVRGCVSWGGRGGCRSFLWSWRAIFRGCAKCDGAAKELQPWVVVGGNWTLL